MVGQTVLEYDPDAFGHIATRHFSAWFQQSDLLEVHILAGFELHPQIALFVIFGTLAAPACDQRQEVRTVDNLVCFLLAALALVTDHLDHWPELTRTHDRAGHFHQTADVVRLQHAHVGHRHTCSWDDTHCVIAE